MSFQQGLSGLNATSQHLQIIGNNIANANTYGSKVARAEFSDVYATALNGSGTQSIGIGTTLSQVAQQFSQGNISTTENPMDLAINGAGFFQVTDGNSPPVFTRNGQFKVDREGFIVNNGGMRLMGYRADDQGTVQPGQAVPLRLPTAGVRPSPTSEIAVEMNLDARQAVTLPGAGPKIDFTDAETYNNATSLTLYDAKGQEVALTYFFQKSATDTWNVFATANGIPISPDPTDPQPITSITFAADGSAPTGFGVSAGMGPDQAGRKDGSFELTDLPPRTYRLTIHGSDFDDKTVEVTVEEGKTADAGTITVTKGRRIGGRVTHGGAPVEKMARRSRSPKCSHGLSPLFASASRYLAEVPKWVMRCASA